MVIDQQYLKGGDAENSSVRTVRKNTKRRGLHESRIISTGIRT